MSILLLSLADVAFTQQNGPLPISKKADTTIASFTTEIITAEGISDTTTKKVLEIKQRAIPILMIFGIGNINEESLSNINSSGKIAFRLTPYQSKNSNFSFTISANKNVTNNDTLLASTLLFPEIGNHSFIGTLEFSKEIDLKDFKTSNFFSPFYEFAYKQVKKDINDTISKSTTDKRFAIINHTIGAKLILRYNDVFEGGFSIIPYLSFFNVADEDKEDYNYIAKQNFKFLNNAMDINDNFTAFGIKTVLEINKFQFFADFRHVIRNESIQVRELRGLKANIGFVFNANITPEK